MLKIINIAVVIFLIIILFLMSFLDTKLNTKDKKRVLFFMTIVFTLFLGYRDIGLDLEPYRDIFNNQGILSINEIIKNGLFQSRLEPFFEMLISIIKKFNFGFSVFLFVSGAIPMLIVYNTIKKTEEQYLITTFLLFILMFFFRGPVDIIRQFFAAAIYLSAVLSLSKGNKKKYWIKGLSSILFHYSNIIIIFVKPLLKIIWNKKKMHLYLVITIVFGLFSKMILSQFDNVNLLNTDNAILWKVGYYLTYYDSVGYQYIGIPHRVLRGITTYFPLIFSFFITELYLNKDQPMEKVSFKSMLLSSQIIGMLLAIYFSIIGASIFGVRIQFLLSIGSFFIVKDVISMYINNKIIYASIIMSLIFYNFVIILYYAGIHDPMSSFYLF